MSASNTPSPAATSAEREHTRLDWTQLDLISPGRTLIEASAGTGKTWTITVLYLRLLLERQLSPREIVVTTFTDAAAQELRERLRTRLVWAQSLAESWPEQGVAANAPADVAWLLARWQSDEEQAPRDRLRLKLAQAELDLAPVGTLHSLCRRILTDYPFESGGGFALGDMVASDSLLDEWSTDLWRQLQQGDGPTETATPDTLASLRKLLKAYLQPGAALWAPDEDVLARLLPIDRAEALEAFAARGSEVFQPRKSALKNALLALAAWLRDRRLVLKESTLKNLAASPWDDQLQPHAWLRTDDAGLLRFVDNARRALGYAVQTEHVRAWQVWLAQVCAWREQRLAARGQLTFDELIARVNQALARKSNTLAARLHAAWPVALVDEFQDTDAQQYDILHAIYSDTRDHDAAGVPRGRLVMIGDPKQAIYRFRGGDIHTYLRAAASADETLRLDVNQRSSRAYVAATNQFYAQVGHALSTRADAPIRYETVRASGRRDGQVYAIDGVPVAQPLQLHFNADYPFAAPARTRAALQACARQIAQLLQSGTHRIGAEPVRPGDIAVLLPANVDVRQLRGMLQQLGVPCVGAGRSSVFETSLARELQVLLYGIEHASDEGAVRAALATRLYGMGFHALKALREQATAWAECEQQFQQWRLRWQRDGVLAVVGELIEHAAPALLAGQDGERALTDLRHLGELLQARAEQLSGPEQLLAWLARQRDGEAAGGEAADEQQLRIESDAHRVRLLTLHASKGLEFPLVFLPLMWRHTQNSMDSTPVIDEPLCGQRVIGFGELAKAQYQREGQDERFRVLYVALTRAIHACHVYVLPPDRPARANSDKPLHDPERAPLDASIEHLLARHAAGENLVLAAPQLAWLADGWPWQSAPLATDVQTAVVRHVLPLPLTRPMRQVYSFSNLTRSAHGGTLEDQAASDEADTAAMPDDPAAAITVSAPADPAPEHPELLALGAIRGADLGNALHAMFELREMGRPMADQRRLIDRCLRDFGVRVDDAERATVINRIARRLQANLDTPLLDTPLQCGPLQCGPLQGGPLQSGLFQSQPPASVPLPDALTLGRLPAHRQLAEMEFHYVLDGASMRALREACERHEEPALVPLAASGMLRGRMTGKVDLIFEHDGRYNVLDYKSNWLGNHVADYLPDVLDAAMDAHHYRFQALLYTVALDRMLRQRMPVYCRQRHLGEAIYLFVRAVSLAPDAGIWRHRFDDALIEAVDRALSGNGAERMRMPDAQRDTTQSEGSA